MKWLIGAVVLVFLGLWGTTFWERQVTTQVISKETLQISPDDSRFIVKTNDGIFENTSTFWHLKWESTALELQLEITPGSCVITYVGVRIPFFKLYPNILEVQC